MGLDEGTVIAGGLCAIVILRGLWFIGVTASMGFKELREKRTRERAIRKSELWPQVKEARQLLAFLKKLGDDTKSDADRRAARHAWGDAMYVVIDLEKVALEPRAEEMTCATIADLNQRLEVREAIARLRKLAEEGEAYRARELRIHREVKEEYLDAPAESA